ncbi:hypothetical protein FJZ21_02815 [Candidatus Pacearchaeota archaeon]|nr:hypothetical protein [Candidatus Pacearchaeota archaeon]
MKIVNVWKEVEPPLQFHEDNRGKIADVFYKADLKNVSIITSKKGVRRGDHYHKETTQHMLMTKGSLIYVYQPVDKSQPVKYVHAKEGQLVSTPPFEIHTLLFPEDNEFIVFSSGLRGGQDYEKDTFRVEPQQLPDEVKHIISTDPKLVRKEHVVRK